MSAGVPLDFPTTTFRPLDLDGFTTGLMDIHLTTGRRVLSVPSQLGCRVGCTFCISSRQPLLRNLRASEMATMVRQALTVDPAPSMPTELSFTGEGEPVLNWRECRDACVEIAREFPQVNAVRYCFSGLGAPQLLGRLEAAGLPMRLQFSLHSARQHVRDALVPRSAPLSAIREALEAHAHRFIAVDLNVVLQAGVNDTEADADALLAWCRQDWRVALNPLLTETRAVVSPRSDAFEQRLRAGGLDVLRYRNVGKSIGNDGLYQKLTFSRR